MTHSPEITKLLEALEDVSAEKLDRHGSPYLIPHPTALIAKEVIEALVKGVVESRSQINKLNSWSPAGVRDLGLGYLDLSLTEANTIAAKLNKGELKQCQRSKE